MTQAEAATFVGELREAFAHLDSLPMPTVACVDGWVPRRSRLEAVAVGVKLAASLPCAAWRGL